jgi:hypothetical protein
MLLYKLDYTIEKTLTYSKSPLLRKEKSFFAKIRDHKWLVSEQLGRDVGLFVATIDYFINIQKLPSMPNTAN